MTSNPMLSAWSHDQRKTFHQVLADWLGAASDADIGELEAVKNQIYPGQICCLLNLVRRCFSRQELLEQLPKELVRRLRAASLLRPCAVA
jgi:hypothetical protein